MYVVCMFVCMGAYDPHAHGAHRDQKRVSDLEMELQMIMSHHLDDGNPRKIQLENCMSVYTHVHTKYMYT